MTGVSDGSIKQTGYDSDGNPREVLVDVVNRATLVSDGGFGSGKQSLIYNLTGIDEDGVVIHIPAGWDIRYASFLFTPSSAPTGVEDLENVQGAILFDADSDTYATAALGKGGALPSGTDPQQFFKARLKEWENKKLTDAMINGLNGAGRIDLRSSDTTITLDCQVVLS